MNKKYSPAAAIKHIESEAIKRQAQAKQQIEHIRQMANLKPTDLDEVRRLILTNASIAINFHPDRLDQNNQTVAQGLLASGLYQSQFVTKVSNGLLAPEKGSARDHWERQLFNFDVAEGERPKYGGLDLLRRAGGPCPRFGSCYFILKPNISQQCTFTYRDSYYEPKEKGSLQYFDDIFAAFLNECFERNFALGQSNLHPQALLAELKQLSKPYDNPSAQKTSSNLDHYIEAQIHGPIELKEDVLYLVADPSFQNTPIEQQLTLICRQYNIDLHWHGGYRLAIDKIPDNFRGATMPSFGQTIAIDGMVTPFAIGQAARSAHFHPEKWKHRGGDHFVMKELKWMWHVLVKWG